jgi:hypothetical protein
VGQQGGNHEGSGDDEGEEVVRVVGKERSTRAKKTRPIVTITQKEVSAREAMVAVAPSFER